MGAQAEERRLMVRVVWALVLAAACNSRSPVLDTPVATPTGPSPTVPTNVTNLSLVFKPPAMMGGTATRGTLTLDRPALPVG